MKLFYIAIIFSLTIFSGCDEDPNPSEFQDQLPDEDVAEVQKDVEENDVEENDEGEIADEVEYLDVEERDEMLDEYSDEVDDMEIPDETAVIETEEDLMDAVVGKYAHYDIVAYYGDMGFMGIFKNLIISYGFTTLEIEDGKLKITDRFCHSEQLSNQDFTSTVPDSMTQAIIPESTYMEIKYDEDGLYLWRPETPTLLGIDYPDSDNTPLPESVKPDDERLVDDDNDGNPGVTVFIDMMGKTEKLYIARREIFAFEAYLQENGNLEGKVHDRSEQLIIDSTNFLLKTQNTEWIQHEDLELSPIFLTPVSADYDCERLMQERDTLLPPNPPVWED